MSFPCRICGHSPFSTSAWLDDLNSVTLNFDHTGGTSNYMSDDHLNHVQHEEVTDDLYSVTLNHAGGTSNYMADDHLAYMLHEQEIRRRIDDNTGLDSELPLEVQDGEPVAAVELRAVDWKDIFVSCSNWANCSQNSPSKTARQRIRNG